MRCIIALSMTITEFEPGKELQNERRSFSRKASNISALTPSLYTLQIK
jgi:hypothetical protein